MKLVVRQYCCYSILFFRIIWWFTTVCIKLIGSSQRTKDKNYILNNPFIMCVSSIQHVSFVYSIPHNLIFFVYSSYVSFFFWFIKYYYKTNKIKVLTKVLVQCRH